MNVDHEKLEELLARVKALRKKLKAESTLVVSKIAIRNEAKSLGSVWHKEFEPNIKHSVPPEKIQRYNTEFTRLIRISGPSNRVSSYLAALEAITKSFNSDFLIPSQQGILTSSLPSAFDVFFLTLANDAESAYLAEAIACAKHGHHRAAAVLGWSAAIDRIHRSLDYQGLGKFNSMSQQMASSTTGRYKKFNKSQNVTNLGELREVFDSTILWVIEAMGLIDTNQHTRLISCFDMRCHGAHPGDAPITTYNLMSFFSDLDQIVFSSPKFKLPDSVSPV